MDKKLAITAFGALSQESRLDVFRRLVQAGKEGMLSGEIATALDQKQNTASVNLSILLRAGLIRNARDGRNVRYFADFDGVAGMLGYLLEDCCGGKADQCRPLINQLNLGD
ncbi:ArsR/SmtB family transcription factor [Halocynthiibacter namhaensis]|uniref:ArsR/SmtB family transcription factor n=1 Tax=Halocynthiibacter namhaensis TaxID=1290553 RepID=UPI00057982E7|nr:helix-turn-helix domain-containing protein [Halocynthiibacter namhaensis]